MKKCLIIIVFYLCNINTINAQTIDREYHILDLKLGMNYKDFLKLNPNQSNKCSKDRNSIFCLYDNFKLGKFEIKSLQVYFYKEQLIQISFFIDDCTELNDVISKEYEYDSLKEYKTIIADNNAIVGNYKTDNKQIIFERIIYPDDCQYKIVNEKSMEQMILE